LKPIKEVFRKNGYDYALVRRSGGAALYSQSKGGVVLGWEVHKVRQIVPQACKGVPSVGTEWMYVPREKLASDEEFGQYGWSYRNLRNALNKFNELCEEAK